MSRSVAIVVCLLVSIGSASLADASPRREPVLQMRGRQEGAGADQNQRQETSNGDSRQRVRGTDRQTPLFIYCTYELDKERKTQCHAGALIQDFTNNSRKLAFEVECAGQTFYNGASRLFVDHKDTRIQAEPGPIPAIVLPPDSLRSGHHRVKARLELSATALEGFCLIYDAL